MFDWAVLLLGEIKHWSLSGIKGLTVHRVNEEVLWDGMYSLSSLPKKTRKSNNLQMSLQRQHFSPQLFKDLQGCWCSQSLNQQHHTWKTIIKNYNNTWFSSLLLVFIKCKFNLGSEISHLSLQTIRWSSLLSWLSSIDELRLSTTSSKVQSTNDISFHSWISSPEKK